MIALDASLLICSKATVSRNEGRGLDPSRKSRDRPLPRSSSLPRNWWSMSQKQGSVGPNLTPSLASLGVESSCAKILSHLIEFPRFSSPTLSFPLGKANLCRV